MKNNSFFKNCLALLLITLVAGFALATVNEVTKAPIAAAEEKAKFEAYETVFPDVKFEALEDTESLLQNASSAIEAKGLNGCTVDDVLAAKDGNGNIIGYVMSATSPSGYGGNIQVALGVSNADSKITGFSVLSANETAGLGAKCTEDDFKGQFTGKSSNGINFTKSGASTDTEIDAISGATITTSAVTDAVNGALAFYNDVLKEG